MHRAGHNSLHAIAHGRRRHCCLKFLYNSHRRAVANVTSLVWKFCFSGKVYDDCGVVVVAVVSSPFEPHCLWAVSSVEFEV